MYPNSVLARHTIAPDGSFIICLEDGLRVGNLSKHLMVRYGMAPSVYLARWGLPADYPMVARRRRRRQWRLTLELRSLRQVLAALKTDLGEHFSHLADEIDERLTRLLDMSSLETSRIDAENVLREGVRRYIQHNASHLKALAARLDAERRLRSRMSSYAQQYFDRRLAEHFEVDRRREAWHRERRRAKEELELTIGLIEFLNDHLAGNAAPGEAAPSNAARSNAAPSKRRKRRRAAGLLPAQRME